MDRWINIQISFCKIIFSRKRTKLQRLQIVSASLSSIHVKVSKTLTMHNTFFCFAKYRKQLTRHCIFYDWTVSLKVLSFRDNTDYSGTRRVNEAPFQQSESLPQSVVFQSNDNDQHIRQEFQDGHCLFCLCSNLSISRSDWWNKSNSYGQVNLVVGL